MRAMRIGGVDEMNFKILIIFLTLYISFMIQGLSERMLIYVCGFVTATVFLKWDRERRKGLKQIFSSVFLGYALIFGLLFNFRYKINLQEPIVRSTNESTAIVLLIEEEPEAFFLPIAINNAFEEFKGYKRPLIPFRLLRDKISYEGLSFKTSSQNTSVLQQQYKSLLGEGYRLYITYTKKPPFFMEGVYEAIGDGNKKIIVAPNLITENNIYETIKEELKAINTSKYQIITKDTSTLWNSDTIALLYVSKINQATDKIKQQNVGVVFLKNDIANEDNLVTALQQEILFSEKIKSLLIEEGYLNYLIQEAAFNRRDIDRCIDRLMEYGVTDVLLINGSSFYHSINQQLELERIIKHIDEPAIRIKTIDINAYDPEVIYEIVKRINLLNIN